MPAKKPSDIHRGKGFIVFRGRSRLARPESHVSHKIPEYLDIDGVHFIRTDGAHRINDMNGKLRRFPLHSSHESALRILKNDPIKAISTHSLDSLERGSSPSRRNDVDPKKIRGIYCENGGIIAVLTKEGKLFTGYAPGGSVNFSAADFNRTFGTTSGPKVLGADERREKSARTFIDLMEEHGIYKSAYDFAVPFSAGGYFGLEYYLDDNSRIRANFPWNLYEGEVNSGVLRERIRSSKSAEDVVDWLNLGRSSGTKGRETKRRPIKQIKEIKEDIAAMRELNGRITPKIISFAKSSALSGNPHANDVIWVIRELGLSDAKTLRELKSDVRKLVIRFHPDRFSRYLLAAEPQHRAQIKREIERVSPTVLSLNSWLAKMRERKQ